MRQGAVLAVGVLMGWISVPGAQAQWLPLDGKAFVDVNGLYQAHSRNLTQKGTLSLYDETGSFEATQALDNGALWDVGFGYRVARELSVGLGVAQFTKSGRGTVSGTVPHPLFYDRPRTYAQDVRPGHRTRTIYLQARYHLAIPAADRLDVALLAGPAHLRVRQGLVGDVSVAEVGPPYSSVNATSVLVERTKSTLGVLVGADVGYRFHPNLGGGLLVRYVAGRVDVPGLAGQPVRIDAGGFQIGGGVRLRF